MLSKITDSQRKRKRSQESEDQLSQIQDKPTQKRSRILSSSRAVVNILSQKAENNINNDTHSINYWIKKESWFKKYFEQDKQLRKYLQQKSAFEEVKHENWFKEKYEQRSNMSYLLARQKFLSSLRRKNSNLSIAKSSDQSREVKSAKYRIANYEKILEIKSSFIRKSKLNITNASKNLCRNLLDAKQTVSSNTLFRDDLFDETCESVRGRNEVMIIRDISPLICSSAQVLRIYDISHLEHLIESVNEDWNSAIPFYDARSQLDYSVKFDRFAFTNEQLEKLTLIVDEITDSYTFYFMIIWRMYFSFLTCEVKCGAATLDVADWQNAHSMTLAVRAVVQLFRLMKREKKLHREILAFSISHDHCTIRIYDHYSVIKEKETIFHRHLIRNFAFIEQDEKEKWTIYKFTKNVYDKHKSTLFKRICSVIDDLSADINFEVSQQSELQFSDDIELQLSQNLEDHLLQHLNVEFISALKKDNSFVDSQETTSNTFFTQESESFKRSKNKRVTL